MAKRKLLLELLAFLDQIPTSDPTLPYALHLGVDNNGSDMGEKDHLSRKIRQWLRRESLFSLSSIHFARQQNKEAQNFSSCREEGTRLFQRSGECIDRIPHRSES